MHSRNKKYVSFDVTFSSSFSKVFLSEINNEIKRLDDSKPTQSDEMLAKVIKESLLLKNLMVWSKDSLKQAHIKSVYKKDSRGEKENCRPVSILPS